MAKRSIIEREKKKGILVDKFKVRREELKVAIKKSTDLDEIMSLQHKLTKLPKNSSPVRHSTRCQQCGRLMQYIESLVCVEFAYANNLCLVI